MDLNNGGLWHIRFGHFTRTSGQLSYRCLNSSAYETFLQDWQEWQLALNSPPLRNLTVLVSSSKLKGGIEEHFDPGHGKPCSFSSLAQR